MSAEEDLDSRILRHVGEVTRLQDQITTYKDFPEVVAYLSVTYRREVQSLYDLEQHGLAKVSLQWLNREGWKE